MRRPENRVSPLGGGQLAKELIYFVWPTARPRLIRLAGTELESKRMAEIAIVNNHGK